MLDVNETKIILKSLSEIQEKVEKDLIPFVDLWLHLEVVAGRISKLASHQEFKYESHDDEYMVFYCEPFIETWRYGGREDHGGETVKIPFSFIEDQIKIHNTINNSNQ